MEHTGASDTCIHRERIVGEELDGDRNQSFPLCIDMSVL